MNLYQCELPIWGREPVLRDVKAPTIAEARAILAREYPRDDVRHWAVRKVPRLGKRPQYRVTYTYAVEGGENQNYMIECRTKREAFEYVNTFLPVLQFDPVKAHVMPSNCPRIEWNNSSRTRWVLLERI